MNYTKGTWIRDGFGINDEHGELIASAHLRFYNGEHIMPNVNEAETEANARLIAVSPEMYQALKLWEKHNQGTQGHYCSECADAIQQAIAKAEAN